MSQITLTGIKPTGTPHLGNYLGAIAPAIQMMTKSNPQEKFLYFIADYHSLTSTKETGLIKKYTYDVAATWLACGLDPNRAIFYRQSDIPEIMELSWILSCFIPKGDLNRAHAYKAAVQQNQELGRDDLDQGINAGLFFYPVLMGADIMLFDATAVPVGQDQRQHVEMARSIAQRLNQFYGKKVLVEPAEKISENVATVVGLDGRKMSKSYDNTIPIFVDEAKLKKLINKIKTDSSGPTEPKDPNDSAIFNLYKAFANDERKVAEMKTRFQSGISWGEAKEALFQCIHQEIAPLREKYDYFLAHPQEIDEVLALGAEKARVMAQQTLERVKSFVLG